MPKQSKIKYLTYECVSRCNMDCKFCFSFWRDNIREIGTEGARQAIKILKDNGLEVINFTGGEPLLRNDICELLEFSKTMGLKTILTTNGILLDKRLDEAAGFLDYISLPLDSPEPVVHNEMRPTGSTDNHHSLIIAAIDTMRANYPEIGIKINTVVTKKNIGTIIDIGELIDGRADSWKLSQFIAGAHGARFDDEFSVTIDRFLNLAADAKKRYPRLNIVAPPAYCLNAGCRILSPDGHLLKPVRNDLIDLGDLLEMMPDDEQFNYAMNNGYLKNTYRRISDG